MYGTIGHSANCGGMNNHMRFSDVSLPALWGECQVRTGPVWMCSFDHVNELTTPIQQSGMHKPKQIEVF